LKNIKLANTIAKLLIVSALSMICTFNNRFSVILLIPYLLWLIFAQALNSSIVYLNKT
jgi:tryptophan-rich sensory protein